MVTERSRKSEERVQRGIDSPVGHVPGHATSVGEGHDPDTVTGVGKSSKMAGVFAKGVAISTWQNAGDDMLSNWTQFAYSRWPFKWFGVKNIKGDYNIGKSNNFWDRYKEDIELAHKLGSTSFRFSFEWARWEPKRGTIDQSTIRRYHEMLDEMAKCNMEPNATLHHFTHPIWFDELGGFTKEENIPLFVEWAKQVFKEFGHRIHLWATFNEPTCYSFLSHIVGMAPPGHIFNLPKSGYILLNILKSHTACYRALKAMPHGKSAMIGLVHHHITFEAGGTGPLYCLANFFAYWATYWWGIDILDRWMLTGEFEYKLPFLGTWITYKDPDGRPPCDWWGINYYTRAVLSWTLSPSCFPTEIMTDMYYPMHAEGLYKAIKKSSAYGIPIYITETGIADSRDDRRAIWIDSYFKQVLRALADGYDVRGFYYWTLMDNFEWATGFTMKFGLYAWEPDGSVDRALKEGSKGLVRFFKTLPDNLQELIQVAKKMQKVLGDDFSTPGVHEETPEDLRPYLFGPNPVGSANHRWAAVEVARETAENAHVYSEVPEVRQRASAKKHAESVAGTAKQQQSVHAVA